MAAGGELLRVQTAQPTPGTALQICLLLAAVRL